MLVATQTLESQSLLFVFSRILYQISVLHCLFQLGIADMFLHPDRRSSPYAVYSMFQDKEAVQVACNFLAVVDKGSWHWTLSCRDESPASQALQRRLFNLTGPQNVVELMCLQGKPCTKSYNSQLDFEFSSDLEMCVLTCSLHNSSFNQSYTSDHPKDQHLMSDMTIFLHIIEVNKTTNLDPEYFQAEPESKNKKGQESNVSLTGFVLGVLCFIVFVVGSMGVAYRVATDTRRDRATRGGLWPSGTDVSTAVSASALQQRYLVLGTNRGRHSSLFGQGSDHSMYPRSVLFGSAHSSLPHLSEFPSLEAIKETEL